MTLTAAHISPIVALIAGVLILLMPRFLNFIVDTIVSARVQRHGVGTRLVEVAAHEATAAGCDWLHVDFVEEHRAFYLGSCGFRPTPAGLRALGRQPGGIG